MVALFIPFASSTLGVSAWLLLASSKSDVHPRVSLEARTDIPNHIFVEEPLSETEQKTLGATTVSSGKFVRGNDDSFRVLFAVSRAKSRKASRILDHTPDICWPQVGFKALELGQPFQVAATIGKITFPFQCRVFRHPAGDRSELVIWCTLLSGRVFPERTKASRANDFSGHLRASFQLLLATLQTVRQPFHDSGEKLFVRCSVACDNDWASALEKMLSFVPEWLSTTVPKQ